MFTVQGHLSRLVCGDFFKHPEIEDIYKYISKTISHLENSILSILYGRTSSDEVTLNGPLYGRKLLETCCNALIGRIEPLRLISVRNVQKKQFKPEHKYSIAIQWSGDIFEKPNDSTPPELWHQELKYEKLLKSLLGTYYFDVFWRPAFIKAVEYNDLGGHFYHEYGSEFTPEKLMQRLRTETSRLFSAFSKGIHSELVVNLENTLDSSTVTDLLRDLLKLLRTLFLISHFSKITFCSLQEEQARELYLAVKKYS